MQRSRPYGRQQQHYCYSASGPVLIARAQGGRDVLNPGMSVAAGDTIHCADKGVCEIEFADGSRLAVGAGSELRIERYDFDVDEDIADGLMTVLAGAVVFQSSAAATSIDTVQIDAQVISAIIRMARVCVVVDASGYDVVTLAEANRGRSLGEVLVQSILGSRALTEPWQSVRGTAEQADLSPVMVLPKSLIDEITVPRRLAPYLSIDHVNQANADEAIPSAFDTGATVFEPFQALGDQLFERRFVPGTVFPRDLQKNPLKKNDLLEDAFDGRRFRLPSDED